MARFNGFTGDFSSGITKGFSIPSDKSLGIKDYAVADNPFKFTPNKDEFKSRIRFYDRDSLWARWRRGYEIYTVMQSVFGTSAKQRSAIGDYRSYCAFQQYPGIFIPARIFTYPSSSVETGEHVVAMRDANAFNFYDFGLPTLGIRYLGDAATVPYSQSGTAITVSYTNHGYQLGDNVYLSILSGTATTSTLTIVAKTANTFTCTAATSATTVGNVSAALSTTFSDDRWTEIRTRLRYLPTPTSSLVGERFTDRIEESDPGLSATYSRIASTVTVTCATAHGLATGAEVNLNTTSGAVISGLYKITVTSSVVFTVTTIESGSSSGAAVVYRLIEKFNYRDYVGYTVKSIDTANNELVFQRTDSYGAQTTDNVTNIVVPAHRGFAVGRFLTTELRYQCSCPDYTRRASYYLQSDNQLDKFPSTAITSTKPGTLLNKDDTISNVRENIGVFSDLGYITSNNFYQLPDYQDKAKGCYTSLQYYQLRWCKHIYASLFSLMHEEGNIPFDIASSYKQTNSPNVIITAANHGLTANTKVQLTVTSGAVLSGQYTISSIIDSNNFSIVYPYSQTTSGYCHVGNLKEHDYVDIWLHEPSDHPVGDGADMFYANLRKEHSRVQQGAERLAMLRKGKNWLGSAVSKDFKNQPQSTGNYEPYILTSLLTDNVQRDAAGNIVSSSGTVQNSTQRMISIVSKVVNLNPTLIVSTKFGFLDQPLINYTTDYQFGLIDAGQYLNGNPTEDLNNFVSAGYFVVGVWYVITTIGTTDFTAIGAASNAVYIEFQATGTGTGDGIAVAMSTIDCSTYDPLTAQQNVVDCGTYS
jgi:hypothetical protein